MKTFIILFLSVLSFLLLPFCPELKAQSDSLPVTFKTGCEIQSELSFSNKYYMDTDSTVYLTCGGTCFKDDRRYSGMNMVEKISRDSSKSMIAYISMELPDEEKTRPAFNFAFLNNKFYAFATTTDYDIATVYACEIDKKTLQLAGQPFKTFTYVVGTAFPSLYVSPHQQCLMFSAYEPIEKSFNTTLHVEVFDGNMEPSWEKKQLETPIGVTSYTMTSQQISDDGTLLIIGCDMYNGKFYNKALDEKRPPFMYHLTTIADHAETVVDRKIDIGKLSIKSIKAEILDNGKVVCAGLYTNDGILDAGISDGVFYTCFEAGQISPSVNNSQAYDENFIRSSITGSNWRRFNDNYLRIMLARNSGDIILITEHILSDRHYELTLIDINNSGKIQWTQKIYKMQQGGGGFEQNQVFSFCCCFYKGNLVVFYNDNIKNSETMNSNTPEIYRGREDCMLMCVIVKPDGELEKHKIQQYDIKRTTPIIFTLHQSGPSDFFYIGSGDNDNICYFHLGY